MTERTPVFPEPVIPPTIRPGDTIGIAAPSGVLDREKLARGLATIESWGFRLAVSPSIYDRDGYLAGTDAQRAALLGELFADPDIRAIVCARGGYGAMRILPRLDFTTLAANPKLFIGFSDVSALLVAIRARTGLVTYHGPVAASLDGSDPQSRRAFRSLLTAGGPAALMAADPVVLRPGRARGTVVGGNLTTLCHLVGTPFAPRFDGKILVLEELGEAPYRIDRMLSQMRMAGCFKGMAGIALGEFKDCGSPGKIYALAADLCREFEIPGLAGFPVGHGAANLPFPIGVPAMLDTDTQRLNFGPGDESGPHPARS